jgi:hypothetical protein
MRHNHNSLYLFAKSADPIRQQNPLSATNTANPVNLDYFEITLQ